MPVPPGRELLDGPRREPQPVFVVTGPSGAGKGTLIAALLARVPELALAVSATTRERRPAEREGCEYHFLPPHVFERLIGEGAFLEHVEFTGHRYGTLRSEIGRIAVCGKVCVLELEIEGALTVKREVPGSVTVFVTAPSFPELERRLRERATESAGEIGERLQLARRQLERESEFDHVVVNDDLGRAANELVALVHERLATAAAPRQVA